MFDALNTFLQDYKNAETIAVNIINLSSQEKFIFNEEQKFYPASFIKLFAAFLAQKKLVDEKDDFIKTDIQDAIKNSLKESDNDALSLLYDYVSETSSGSYVAQEYLVFKEKRNLLTNFFQEQGFSEQLKLHNKCFSFAPYGVDKKLFLDQGSNQVLINDMQKIFFLILDEANGLLQFMQRDGSCYQSNFIFQALNKNDIDFFFSKAAWTSTVRHDLAYFSYKQEEYLAIFMTKDLSDKEELITELASLAFIPNRL